MRYTTYGSTGKSVSCVGFGGMRFDESKGIDTLAKLVFSAYKKGINYFDTAPGYGNSEKIFGTAFKQMIKTWDKTPFYVSTKTMGETADEVRRDLETSLERMGIDSVDFFHMWCVMSQEDYQKRKQAGVLNELDRLKREGLVKHICISTHMNGDDTKEVLQDYPFDGVLLGYSVMNFLYRDVGVQAAADNKMGVTVMNPLGGGIIPQNPERFSFVTTQENETVVEGAIRFLLNDPRIAITLIGFSEQEHLTAALKTVDGFSPIPQEKRDAIKESLSFAMNELCTNCRYCDGCPEDVAITQLMDAYNQILLTHKPKELLDRLKWHWGMDLKNLEPFSRCTRCGRCEELCTQKLPIQDRLEAIREQVVRYRQTLPKKEMAVYQVKSLLRGIRSTLKR